MEPLTPTPLRELLHDIATPVNVILGYAALLERTVSVDVEEREALAAICQAADQVVVLLAEAKSNA